MVFLRRKNQIIIRQTGQRKKKAGALFILALIIISFFIVFPLWREGIVFGNDSVFHFNRSEYWFRLLKQHNFYSYGNFLSFNKIGYPLDVFYPFFTYYPIAVIRLILGSPINSWYAFLFLVNILTGLLCWWIAEKLWKNHFASFIFAIFYLLSYYRIICLFYRGDIGEVLAMTFMPLCIYGMYMVIQEKKSAILFLGIGLTLVSYSHILSIMLINIVLFLFFIFNIDKFLINGKTRWKLLFASVGIFLGLSLIIIGPLLSQMRDQILLPALKVNLRNSQVSFITLIKYSAQNIVYTSNWAGFYHLGTFVVTALFAGGVFFKKLSRNGKSLLLVGIVLIFFITFMNFDILQNTIFSEIQFIWRFNGIISLCAAFVLGELVSKIKLKIWGKLLIASIIIIMLLVALKMERELDLRMIEDFGQGITATNYADAIKQVQVSDYLTEKMTNERVSISNHEIRTSNENTSIEKKIINNQMVLWVSANTKTVVDTFVPIYKGINIEVNGQKVNSVTSNRDTVQVNVESGENVIVIGYRMTIIQKICWVITLLMWTVIIVSSIYYYRIRDMFTLAEYRW
ncbi:6-pyruvoyl-tetrahydropterin synthase-related protein [Listeria ilorinensis]|uniref:6-pyruvoyl-tetrahydropterin synthase-related protein n=1 Tax=Listeria ilorinensis TaxID=2867439 RepID=UPI001EF486D0|nr:6-pyruvoyl-tetrahydropterin synthase-related protein [Listeria ilorinensis]